VLAALLSVGTAREKNVSRPRYISIFIVFAAENSLQTRAIIFLPLALFNVRM